MQQICNPTKEIFEAFGSKLLYCDKVNACKDLYDYFRNSSIACIPITKQCIQFFLKKKNKANGLYLVAGREIHDHSPSPTASSKKINLKSSDGDVFEVDYAVALMSKTIEDAVKNTNPVGDTDHSIHVSLVSSKILTKVIEYWEKHSEKHMSDADLWDWGADLSDWDAEFVDDVDHETLFGLVLSANYLNIKSLLDLASNKIGDMMKGKTPEEIRNTFNIKDDCAPQEED